MKAFSVPAVVGHALRNHPRRDAAATGGATARSILVSRVSRLRAERASQPHANAIRTRSLRGAAQARTYAEERTEPRLGPGVAHGRRKRAFDSVRVGFAERPNRLARLPPTRGTRVAVARRRDQDAVADQLVNTHAPTKEPSRARGAPPSCRRGVWAAQSRVRFGGRGIRRAPEPSRASPAYARNTRRSRTSARSGRARARGAARALRNRPRRDAVVQGRSAYFQDDFNSHTSTLIRPAFTPPAENSIP